MRADLFGVLLQFTRTAFGTLHGDEQGRGVAEIVNDEGLQDAGGQLGLLQERQARADLCPGSLVIDSRHT